MARCRKLYYYYYYYYFSGSVSAADFKQSTGKMVKIGKGKGHPITGHEGPTGGVEV
jgi:hypothetical protein